MSSYWLMTELIICGIYLDSTPHRLTMWDTSSLTIFNVADIDKYEDEVMLLKIGRNTLDHLCVLVIKVQLTGLGS